MASQVSHNTQDQTCHVHSSEEKIVLVSPDSTTDPHPTEVEATKSDLLWFWSTSVSEFPARLDFDRFRAALSKTLAVYRPACGRMRMNSAIDWKFVLTDSPMPLEVVECANPPQLDDNVGQPPEVLAALLPRMSAAHEVINADLPLVNLKLTLSPEKTFLGISWHHALGDSLTRLRFLSLVSRNYEGLEPLYPLPSFERHHFFDPTRGDEKLLDDSAFIKQLSGMSELPKMDAAAFVNNEPSTSVYWIVPRAKANILRQNMQQGVELKLSQQDCLTAYLVSTIHRCGHDIRRVTCTIGWRGVHPEWAKDEVAGNLASIAATETLEDADARDPRRVALKLRQTISGFRTAEAVSNTLRKSEQFFCTSAEKGDWTGIYACALIPNVFSTNHMAGLTWQESVTFGHPGTKYYTPHYSQIPFAMRILAANPTAERSATDAFEAFFSVPQSMHSKVMEQLKEENYLRPFH